MKLYIDTSSNQKTIVSVGNRKIEENSSVWRSQVVLPLIDRILREEKLKLADVSEIEVNPGPGSYTGLKVGVAIANALGLVLAIPVNGKLISSDCIVEPIFE